MPTNARPLARPWYGIDTERDAITGEFVCGWAYGDGGSFAFKGLEDFLPGTYWVWNIGYDIEGLLRNMADPDGWAARKDGAPFPLRGGRAVYYHGKRFDWKGPNGRVSFIEASSFYGRVPLSKVGSKGGVDASKMSLERYLRNRKYREEVDAYCVQDARIVWECITRLAEGLESLGVLIGSTPGATARRFLSKLGEFPPVIWQTHTAFLRSYCGGRFEIVKRGVLWDVLQYDIKSAYPWALAQCPWLTGSAYHRTGRRFSEGALYGSYLVEFGYDDYLGIAPQWKEGVRVYSKAQEYTWLARPEVAWLLEQGADISIKRGVEIFDENASDLWREVNHNLFDLKEENKGNPTGDGAKTVVCSMYGILIQLVQRSGTWVLLAEAENPVDFTETLAMEAPPKEFEAGKYYAPVYAGHLTALTRIKLLDAARSVGEEAYIGGHTDSILTTKPLRLDIGKKLGQWTLERTAEKADICKTGMYGMTKWDFGEFGGLGESVKLRGITREGRSSMLWDSEHKRRTRMGIKRARSWDEVSVISDKMVRNNFAVDKKRVWNEELTQRVLDRGEYIDSEALAYV